jgi:hypothetical protein
MRFRRRPPNPQFLTGAFHAAQPEYRVVSVLHS